QRCTTLRRLFVHRSIAEQVLERLLRAYSRLKIGHPLDPTVLVGPLIDEAAFETMQRALATLRAGGARVHGGERVTDGVPPGGFYVRPAIVEATGDEPLLAEETFAPILYFLRYDELGDAIERHNAVPQGL